MKALAIAAVCVALTACDKGASSPKASGALDADEAVLFKNLPPGGNIVFGGNYMKVQAFMQTAMGEAIASMGPGWKEWTACWAGLGKLEMAGTASFSGAGGQMSMVFSGATLADMKQCADKAGFKAALDSDGKFLSTEITTMGQTVEQGTLQLPNGVLYSRQSLGFGGAGTVVPGSRTDLEGDIAKLAQGTALDDPKLKQLVTKIDRSKTMWFAGTAAGTPIADKLGEVYGSFEVVPGMAMDVTAEVLDGSIADKVMTGIKEVKDNAAQVPAEFRSMIKNLSVTRDGNRLRVVLKLSDAEVAGFMKQVGAFSGAGR